MNVVPTVSVITGIPDYYKVYRRWLDRYERTGDKQSYSMALHYARVAQEMGQARIDEDRAESSVTVEIERDVCSVPENDS
jgi:hypothetical protein